MARQARIEYEGAYYHVMSRGDRREAIFEDAEDREMFMQTLGECCERSGWRVYAWVLMSNHYHWVLQTPAGNLVEGMRWFQNTYTRRFNTKHKKWGHVFGGRYKAVVVEGKEGDRGDYLISLMDYVHLNPARARLIKKDQGLGLLSYPWSSLAQGYALPPEKRKKWMAISEGLALYGYADQAKGRRLFVNRLEKWARENEGEMESPHEGLQNTLQRGWYWGSQSFRETLLGLVKKGANRNYRSSQMGREREADEAEQWLERGRLHFDVEGPLMEIPREVRLAIAWAIWRRTNQPQGWIAAQLSLHTAANVSQQVRRFQKDVEKSNKRHVNKKRESWIAFVKGR